MTNHQRRGTCNNNRCRFFGLCHCGCGLKTKLAIAKNTRDQAEKDKPWIWHPGHCPQKGGGAYLRRGVPIEKIKPLLYFLQKQYQTLDDLEIVTGVKSRTIKRYLYNNNKHVVPENVIKIVKAVAAHRRPRDIFVDYSSVRMASLKEREFADIKRLKALHREGVD